MIIGFILSFIMGVFTGITMNVYYYKRNKKIR